MTDPALTAALERLQDLWTRASVEMEGCPIPTEACQVFGCNASDDPCEFDRAIKGAAQALADVRRLAIEACAREVERARLVLSRAQVAELLRALLPPPAPTGGRDGG